jgi:hypothetical protein
VIVYSATNRTPPKMSTAILSLIAIWWTFDETSVSAKEFLVTFFIID